MKWACFALLVAGLLVLFVYEFGRREPSWDGAPDAADERGGLEEEGWFGEPWLWRRGTDAAGGSGFQRRGRERRRRRLLRGEDGNDGEDREEKRLAAAAARRRLQLLAAGALKPFDLPPNFTTAGLRVAPPYGVLSNCFFMYVLDTCWTNRNRRSSQTKAE